MIFRRLTFTVYYKKKFYLIAYIVAIFIIIMERTYILNTLRLLIVVKYIYLEKYHILYKVKKKCAKRISELI